MPTIFDKLCAKFEHIYMLTLASRKDRHIFMNKQLQKIGYDPNNINHLKKFTIIYTSHWRYNKDIIAALNRGCAQGPQLFTKPNEYDCTRNHYNIIDTGYELGYDNILVMEDDIAILEPEKLEAMIDNMPESYDLCQLSGFTTDPRAKQFHAKYFNGEFYTKATFGIWCTAMYAMSRVGMQWYLTFQNTRLSVADMPLYYHPEDTYVACIPWAIQMDKNVMPSDIRNSDNDHIDYNKQNMYEIQLNKDWYGVPDRL